MLQPGGLLEAQQHQTVYLPIPHHPSQPQTHRTGAAATQAPGAGALRDTPVFTRVCCYMHSCHIREPHPELCFKCKQAAAWSFPSTCFTPCINLSVEFLDFKIGDNRESPTMLLTPSVSYIFCISDEVLFVSSSFIWPLQISSYWYSVFLPGDR